MISDEDTVKCVDDAEWTKTPYALAVGVQESGSTQMRNTIRAQYYAIHNPAHNMLTEDFDEGDDTQDDFFYREPPAFTVARVRNQPHNFLSNNISRVIRAGEFEFETLSTSTTEIVETTISNKRAPKEYVRFGLFPE
jgi:hypothetical protein